MPKIKIRPYIRSSKVISEKGHIPKVRVIVVTDKGLRQYTHKTVSVSNLNFVAKAFLSMHQK